MQCLNFSVSEQIHWKEISVSFNCFKTQVAFYIFLDIHKIPRGSPVKLNLYHKHCEYYSTQVDIVMHAQEFLIYNGLVLMHATMSSYASPW